MGVDICAYTNARLVPVRDWDEGDGDRPDRIRSVYYGSFLHAVEGLDLPPLGERDASSVVFEVDPTPWRDLAPAHFSYGGYSAFRNELAALSGKVGSCGITLEQGDPFWEMCWMSDCDGFFSTDACKKIAADFEKYRGAFRAAATVETDPLGWSLKHFDQVAAVFRRAADNNGIVSYS